MTLSREQIEKALPEDVHVKHVAIPLESTNLVASVCEGLAASPEGRALLLWLALTDEQNDRLTNLVETEAFTFKGDDQLLDLLSAARRIGDTDG